MKQRIRHILFQRHLIFEFLKRDLQARYLGSAIGVFWSVINPLILFVVYFFVFGVILRARYEERGLLVDGEAGFAFYIFCGLLPWFAFQESLMRMTTCIVDNAHLIKQVRFPAKILPAYLALSSIINQLIGTLIYMAGFIIVSGSAHVTWLGLPLAIALELVFFFGLGLFFSTLHAYFRDVGPLVSIIVMVMMWSTPMLYTLSMVEQNASQFLPVIYANPLSYVLFIHHDLMLNGTWPSLQAWGAFAAIAFASLAAGYALFTRCHSEFADLL